MAETIDEIQHFQDARYVSACESAWRILGYSLHQQYPSVNRLEVHLPESQWVTFNANSDLQAVLDNNRETMLTSWFILNQNDPNARQYLY